jgi:nitrate reductase assembly molybdenum cofactor insertion protein NarJ
MSDFNTDTSGQKADEFTEPSGGPEPTEKEIAAADRSAAEVDLESVDEHYTEMNERGKNTSGEGQIAP